MFKKGEKDGNIAYFGDFFTRLPQVQVQKKKASFFSAPSKITKWEVSGVECRHTRICLDTVSGEGKRWYLRIASQAAFTPDRDIGAFANVDDRDLEEFFLDDIASVECKSLPEFAGMHGGVEDKMCETGQFASHFDGQKEILIMENNRQIVYFFLKDGRRIVIAAPGNMDNAMRILADARAALGEIRDLRKQETAQTPKAAGSADEYL